MIWPEKEINKLIKFKQIGQKVYRYTQKTTNLKYFINNLFII